MSIILARENVVFFSQPSTSQVTAPLLRLLDEPASPRAPAVTASPDPSQNASSLRQLRLQESVGRAKRDAIVESAAAPTDSGKVRRRYPTTAEAEKADATLQKNVVQWLITGETDKKNVPENASIAPFVELYRQAIKEPSVQAWFTAQGLKPQTLRVFSDGVVGVVGVVVRDGKETIQRFSTTDGSGWGQVSKRISALQHVLSPSDLGLPGLPDNGSIGRDVLLDFYAVKPPLNEKSAPQLGKQLKQGGWPAIAQTQRSRWQSQFNDLSRHREDSAIRTRLVEQFRSQFTNEPDSNVFSLDEQTVDVGPGSSLDQKSKEPRTLFLEFLASPTFQAFFQKAGYSDPGRAFRLSTGELQVRNFNGDWVSVQQAFDDEVEEASRTDDVTGHAARKMNEDFGQLVEMSKKTGDALYPTHTYDARQVLAFYASDVPQTVGQLRATLGWLNTQLPQPPLAADYASMTPYGQDAGGLSAEASKTLKGQSAQVMALLKGFSSASSDVKFYPDPDRQLAAFFDSPQAIVLADAIAKSLKLFAVADGQALTRAERHQLLATALKFSVDAPVPGGRGTVAGYALYPPENMGLTLKEVRERVERHLQSKGVDAKVSAFMAHMFLAQSAPEMLVKKDPSVPADTAKILNRDPENIKVGSTAWLNLRLGAAIAGDSRLNLTQVMALARQGVGGPKQEALIKELGTQALLDWGVMAGVFPATSDGKYSLGDYEAASKAFTQRENQTREAFATLMSEPPTQASLLVEQLALLLPEIPEEHFRNLKLEGYPPTTLAGHAAERQSYNLGSKLLVDVILMNQAEGKPPLGVKESWTNGAFIHPNVSLASFRERLKLLPQIKPLVEPAVDQYIASSRAAEATTLKLMIADLPLEERKALESGEITFYTLRKTTGDPLTVDRGPDSNVQKSKGTHGLLLRYKTQPSVGYYEVFPGSFKMVKRTDLPFLLPLNGRVENEILRDRLYTYAGPVIRNGTPQPFDVEAYTTGSVPRPNAQSQVIIEPLGPALPQLPKPDHTLERLPNTFFSSRTSQIVDRFLAHSFEDNRDARITYANEPTALHKRTYPVSTSRLFTAETARALLSLIPFVGAIADLVDGNIEAGVKGLLIDFGSFLLTGGAAGAKSFAKGLKILVPFSGKPFSMQGLKGGGSFIRGLFNPLENIPDLLRSGKDGVKALNNFAKWTPAHIGSNVYLPIKAFEQWRWTVGAWEMPFADPSESKDNLWPGARKGLSGSREVFAVQKNGSWYAISPVSHKPQGAPLEHFTPDV